MEGTVKRTKISRLNYIKLILKKVSFSPLLFKKELQKGLQECTTEQLVILKRWCLKHFASLYSHIIIQVFRSVETRLLLS